MIIILFSANTDDIEAKENTAYAALGQTACTNGYVYKNGRCEPLIILPFDDDCSPEDKDDDLC